MSEGLNKKFASSHSINGSKTDYPGSKRNSGHFENGKPGKVKNTVQLRYNLDE